MTIRLKNIYLFCLFIVGVGASLCNAQQLLELRVVGKGQFLPDELIAEKVIGADGQEYTNVAGLLIVSNMESLSFTADRGIIKAESKPGEDRLFLQPENSIVYVSKEGYVPLQLDLVELGIRLEKGQVWKLEIAGFKLRKEARITLTTDPPGATVYVDSIEVSTDGVFITTQGLHKVMVSKAGYFTENRIIEVTETQTFFSVQLKLPVTIEVNKPEAEIYIDKRVQIVAGTHPLLPGKHNVRIELEGYKPIDKTIDVSEDNTHFRFRLRRPIPKFVRNALIAAVIFAIGEITNN